MNQTVTRKTALRALFILAGALMPLAAAQAVSPLGWEIPEVGTSSRAPATDVRMDPQGPSPLGFVIPQPGPRGAAGPMREDSTAAVTATRERNLRLAGIGGTETN